MRRVIAGTGVVLAVTGCLESSLPAPGVGALRPPDFDTAVLQSTGAVETDQATYAVRQPLTLPWLVFDGPEGGVLRLRFRDLTNPGTQTTDGQLVVFEWTAPGGRVFSPESVCALTLLDPRGQATTPSIEGRTICEARAADGARVTVAAAFVVAEP